MTRFLENLQKELFSPAHSAAIEAKRLTPSLPSVFSQALHHHQQQHQNPYISQMLYNNPFINHYAPPPPPPMIPFGNTLSDRAYPFRLSTPKKRRTKVKIY